MAEISIHAPEGMGRLDFTSRVAVRAVAAGTLVTLATLLLVATLGASLGFVGISRRAGMMNGVSWLWIAIAGVVAGYLGGYVAAIASRAHDRRDGLLHGFVTWAASCVLLSITMALGLVLEALAISEGSTAPFAGFFLADALALCAALVGGYYGVRSEAKAEAHELEKAQARPMPPAPKMA